MHDCRLGVDGADGLEEAAIEQELAPVLERVGVAGADVDARGPILLVLDAAGLFSQAAAGGAERAGGGSRAALGVCLDVSWKITRAVADGAFLPGGRGGRIVYLAPPADGREHADAARAGLENLARTLSIEWARHGITAVAIAPGGASAATRSPR